MMSELVSPLIFTAFSLGFIHTLLGPDHYLPFVALSKSNHWSFKKTLWISGVCGLGHCFSSVFIGFFGIGLGVVVGKLEVIEGVRGDWASYLLISIGLVYFVWSVKNLIKREKHAHPHRHGNLIHDHSHAHTRLHVHQHKSTSKNLFWGIFIVFVLGPCEPLIPLLMVPAAKLDVTSIILVSVVFTITTVGTMLAAVTLLLKGTSLVRFSKLEKYTHPLASLTLVLCGVLIVAGL